MENTSFGHEVFALLLSYPVSMELRVVKLEECVFEDINCEDTDLGISAKPTAAVESSLQRRRSC